MKVAVITPTLGISTWLPETVESVATCAVGCTHVLVAPETRTRELARRFPAVTVVPEKGGGMYAAINAGLDSAAGCDAFTYLNDDDLLLPDFASVLRAIAGQVASPVIAFGGVRLIDEQGRRLGRIPISPSPTLNRRLYAQRLEPVYQHGTLFTRAVVDQIGGFDESFRLCGDSEFLARACVRGMRFVRATSRDVAGFRLRPGQLTKSREAMLAERRRVDEKLGLLDGGRTFAHRIARWKFRLANAPAYAERIARHGWISFDQLLEK